MRSEKGGEEEKEKQQERMQMERQDRKKDHNSARNSRRRRPLRIWKEEGESDRQRTKQGKQSSLKTTGEEKEESR